MEGKDKLKQTIAEIRIDQEVDPKEQFLDDYNHCPLCGTELSYTHVTDFAFLQVNEEAHCDPCGVRIKKEKHVLN